MRPTRKRTRAQASLDCLRDFLGLERNVLVRIAAGAIGGFGVLLWSGYLPKVLEELGARGRMIGAFATVGAVVGLSCTYLGGVLSDRLGRGHAMILASVVSMCGYLVFMVAPTWWMFLPGAVLTAAGATFGFMGSMALFGDALRARRRAIGMAVGGAIGLLPSMLAPIVGAALIQRLGLVAGVRFSLRVTIALMLVAILFQRRYYNMPPPADNQDAHNLWSAWRIMSPDLKRMLGADCLVRFGSGMSAIFVVLYVLNVLKASVMEFGLLMSLQAVLPAVLALPVAKLADRAGRASRRPFIIGAFFFFAAFPLALAAVPSGRWLVPVFVIGALRHVCEPPRKAYIVDLATGPSRGRVIGLYHLIRGIATFPAALVGGLLYEWLSPAPFIVGGVTTGLGLIWFVCQGSLQRDTEERDGEVPHDHSSLPCQ